MEKLTLPTSIIPSLRRMGGESVKKFLLRSMEFIESGVVDESGDPSADALFDIMLPYYEKRLVVAENISQRNKRNRACTPSTTQKKVTTRHNTSQHVTTRDNVGLLEERKNKFIEEVQTHTEYPSTMLDEFLDYWTEPNKSNTKFRMENEKTWDTPKRLKRWADNSRFTRNRGNGIILTDNSQTKYKKEW